MNFLSHYFFDHNKNDDHYNFGLILPDLARNFVPGARIKPSSVQQRHPEIRSINQGCEQHVATDKIFHQWEGFDELQTAVKTELRRNEAVRPERDWFVAHIFAELMIDHQLLKNNPELATELYNSFGRLNTGSVNEFLLDSNMDSEGINRFQKGLERFMEVRYLSYYDDPETVVYSLERICTRMRIPPFDVRQKAHYTQLISGLERIIVDTITKLQTLLK